VTRPSVLRRPAAAVLLLAVACAPGRPALPTGAGQPFADAPAALDAATSVCRGVRTWTAEMSLSGQSGRQKLRGRLIAGLAPAALYLEAVAPFGRPIFRLAARDGRATLLLPRDGRVLRDAAPADVVEALTGVALDPDQLRALVSGCVAPAPVASGGRTYPGGWLAVDLGAGATAFLKRRDGGWRIEAGRLSDLTVEYRDALNGLPRRLRLRSEPGAVADVDLTLDVSQIEVNVAVPDRTFVIEGAADAVPMTLEELRAAGPLGDKR